MPLDESGALKVSQTSYDYTRPYWDQIGATIVGRHVFDMTDGWDGKPPGGVDHVVVVTHRPKPEGWDAEAPFHFVDGVEAAVATAQELAGDRMVEVAAGDVGGQVLAAGLVDEVRMDVVPVVFGSGKRYFGSVDAQHLLEEPDVVIQGNRSAPRPACHGGSDPVAFGQPRGARRPMSAAPAHRAASVEFDHVTKSVRRDGDQGRRARAPSTTCRSRSRPARSASSWGRRAAARRRRSRWSTG